MSVQTQSIMAEEFLALAGASVLPEFKLRVRDIFALLDG